MSTAVPAAEVTREQVVTMVVAVVVMTTVLAAVVAVVATSPPAITTSQAHPAHLAHQVSLGPREMLATPVEMESQEVRESLVHLAMSSSSLFQRVTNTSKTKQLNSGHCFNSICCP